MKAGSGEKLVSCALALTVAAPMCYVVQLSMGIVISGWYAFVFAAGFLLLLELITWNRVTLLAVPAAILLFAAFLWWAIGEDGRAAFSDFYGWALGFIRYGDTYPLGYGIALTAVASLPVTLIVWLFGRKFLCFPALFAFVAGVALLKWLNGLDSVLTPSALAAGGLLLVWAKAHQRKMSKQEKRPMPENGVAFSLLPAAALIVLISLSAASADASRSWQNEQIFDLFSRFNNYLADYTNFNRPRYVYSIASYGYMPLGTRLGGPIDPPDMQLMSVSAPRQMLLRGMVFNAYTGDHWADTTGSKAYRLNDDNKALSDNAFDVLRPVLSGIEKENFNRFISRDSVSVNPLLNEPSTLFVPVRGLRSVASGKLFAVLPKFNAKGEAYSTFDLRAGYSYKITSDDLLYDSPGFDEEIEHLEGLNLSDPAEQSKYISSNYLALPDNIEKNVYDLTNGIVSGGPVSFTIQKDKGTETIRWAFPAPANDYEKALAIKDFLTKCCSYTLSPDTPPDNVDFVSYFIDRKPEGYCTYFASAMAVMARIAGIPSRYAEGYLLPDKQGSEKAYTVSAKDAHAWAELYFPGVGWVPFDATPSGTGSGAGSSDQADAHIPVPTPHPTANPSEDLSLSPAGAAFSWQGLERWLWALPVGLAASAALWVCGSMLRERRRTSLRFVLRRLRDLRRCCAFYYAETIKLLEYYNNPLRTGETPYAYAERIDSWLRLEAGRFAQAAHLISLLSYSDYEPTEADAEFMAMFRKALAKYTYHTVGPWFYLKHQVLGFKRRANPRKHPS